jgi:hypothetical protein
MHMIAKWPRLNARKTPHKRHDSPQLDRADAVISGAAINSIDATRQFLIIGTRAFLIIRVSLSGRT